MLSFWIVLYIGIIGGSIYGNILVLWIVRTTRSLQNVNNLLVANLAGTGQLFSERVSTHWTYFMQILSNYNTKSLYHIENSVIRALKIDIFHSYTCEINIGDIWLQFEKLKFFRQMALSYRNIKNKY